MKLSLLLQNPSMKSLASLRSPLVYGLLIVLCKTRKLRAWSSRSDVQSLIYLLSCFMVCWRTFTFAKRVDPQFLKFLQRMYGWKSFESANLLNLDGGTFNRVDLNYCQIVHGRAQSCLQYQVQEILRTAQVNLKTYLVLYGINMLVPNAWNCRFPSLSSWKNMVRSTIQSSLCITAHHALTKMYACWTKRPIQFWSLVDIGVFASLYTASLWMEQPSRRKTLCLFMFAQALYPTIWQH